jgi:hypothetical protein
MRLFEEYRILLEQFKKIAISLLQRTESCRFRIVINFDRLVVRFDDFRFGIGS